MKNKDLVPFNAALQEVSDIRGKDFAYAVFKNKSIVEKELEIFKQLQRTPHPDFQSYEQERHILCVTHSIKDENGQPKILNNRFEIDPLQQIDFQNEFQDLKEKYNDVIQDMQNAEQEYNDFLEKDSTIELIKVKFEDLPENVNASFLERIKWMIK
jgi:hypothetical protein